MSAEQLDMFDALSGEDMRQEARRQAQQQHRERRSGPRPDGQPMQPGEAWCGRCGENDYAGSLDFNHDLGYCGCPTDFDPTWSQYLAAPGFRSVQDGDTVRSMLTVDEICDRWDRQFFPNCDCGHPWGVHRHGTTCYTYCGCDSYSEAGA